MEGFGGTRRDHLRVQQQRQRRDIGHGGAGQLHPLVGTGTRNDIIWSSAGNDGLYGGIGADCVYVSRDDGTGHYCGGDGRNDEIVMFRRFALTAESIVGGFFAASTDLGKNNGNGVSLGRRLGSDSDSDVTIACDGTQVSMVNDQTGATIVFSGDDVAAISLWNSDAAGAQRFVEVFEWNASQNAYTFDHNG